MAGAVLPSHLTNGMTGHLRFTRQTRSLQKAGSSSTTKNTKISDSPEKPSHNPAPKQASSFIPVSYTHLQTLCGWGGREDYLQQDIPFVEAGRGCTGHFGDGNAGNSSVSCAASGMLPYSDREGYRFPETAYTESEVHFPGQ